jgi:tRNA(Ile)-lysidine synthase
VAKEVTTNVVRNGTRHTEPQKTDPLLAAILHAHAEHGLFMPPPPLPRSATLGATPVVVGVSGGADSVCLLHALYELAVPLRLALHVAHVDHGLRPTAGDDRAFVAALAARWGLPLHVAQLDPAALRQDPRGLEAAARAARYAFFAAVARRVGPGPLPATVAVAHHAGDQAETVLLHLVQGSGLKGLGGLRPVTVIPFAPENGGAQNQATGAEAHTPAVRLVRPLLGVARADITAYLVRHGQAWIEDETNADTALTRNRLRHVILPALAELNPNIEATLARTAELLAAEADRSEAADAEALAQLLTEPLAGRAVLHLSQWQALTAAAQRGVLRAALDRLGAERREIGFEQIEQIMAAATGVRSSGPHPLALGLAWSIIGATAREPARLSLHRAGSLPLAVDHPLLPPERCGAERACAVPIPGACEVEGWRLVTSCLAPAHLPPDWRTGHPPWRLYADAAALGEPFLTSPAQGQRIAPLGMGGQHRLVADVLGSHKVPAAMRRGWPLLVDRHSGQVLWVCGLHSAESIRISAETENVVCFDWQPI